MLAARYKLPAVYYARSFATGGGLIAYGSSRTDEFRRAASYVDRILKGEKSGDLPVQTHLTHVYTKLGLTSRVQLAQDAAKHA